MRRLLLLSAAAAVIAGQTVPALAQSRLDAAYSVHLTGIPIGQGAVIVDFTETGFAAAGTAKFTGLLRMVSSGEGSTTVRGSFGDSRVLSSIFTMSSNSAERSEKVDITVEKGVVKTFSVTPPPKDAGDDKRLPITEAQRRNVVDPMSAGVILAASPTGALNPDSCNRTLPIFDARIRYDVVLSYLRTETAPKKIKGYSGPVIVCQARYVAISGHRTDRPGVKQMEQNKELFVWLAPVAGTRVLVPIKVSIATGLGTLVVEATRFRVEPGRQAQQPAR